MKKKTKQAGRSGGGARPALDPELISLMQLVEAGRYPEVEVAARRILEKRPKQTLAMKALSMALIETRRFEEALPILELATKLNPNDPELHNNLGIVLSMLMHWDESVNCFKRALALTPKDYEFLKNLGSAYFRMHRWNEAIDAFLKAIEAHPGDYVEAIALLADALVNLNRVDEAWVCFTELWQADSENIEALWQLVHTGLKRCEWQDLQNRLALLRAKTGGLSTWSANPFVALSFPGVSNNELKVVSENFLRTQIRAEVLSESTSEFGQIESSNPQRLKIGYLSADFKNHPVALVIAELIERHDRSRVEIFGYSMGIDDASPIRRRLAVAFDHFIDIERSSVHKTAERIREDGIHILIDLSGWTAWGRPEALALRCAPVQVNWLGFAGTLGHSKLADYLIGDATATPFDHASAYTETLVHLPHSYMPADTTVTPASPPGRREAGLPESGFVYCSFNNSYKYNSDVFDLWCRILAASPGSYLWLSTPGGSAADNLRREMAARNIDPERLIFAPRVETREAHLGRLQLADLALDPFPYNSHSTGVDVLWAGVPMIALLGETFPSRVGASLLRAVELPDLVADSKDQYFDLAVSLFRDSDRLAEYRRHLAKRQALPLFNMADFAKAMEDLCSRMWSDHTQGIRRPIALQ